MSFEKANQRLQTVKDLATVTPIELAGAVQFYQLTFELAWKTLKDYLNAEGFDVKSPREVLKQGFAINLLADGDAWMEMLAARNSIVHLYSEEEITKIYHNIRDEYADTINRLCTKMKTLQK